MGNGQSIRTAQSCQADARLAVRELHAALRGDDLSLVLFFCSSKYDLDALGDEMGRQFGNIRVVGCTTAGEIGPAGYLERSLSGVAFPAGACTAVSGLLDRLQDFHPSRGQALADDLLTRLAEAAPSADASNSFAIVLIDGLSVREEPLARTLQVALGDIPITGGSAGDDLAFNQTWVYFDGAFHTDSAVVVLANTSLPFKVFKTQHFVSGHERLVVTSADADRRIVREINGLPATEAYAQAIGIPVAELDSMHFAAAPIVVVIDGSDYIRAIQKANPDGSLTFYCAIEEGLVLRVAQRNDLLSNLRSTFDAIQAEIGPPQFVLGCDCILRNIEARDSGLKAEVAEMLRHNHTVGFSTYGEQYCGVHVSQTFTGLAIGSSRKHIDE
ncbi:MAG TPA: nitric oxide-sensing protein NosP [Rhodocyclaceae bacterium]|nr:nitric oxide-sensing protein NosP [Rhodocyclaceae bacterium]